MGRHRKPTKLVVRCARIAVGGLALAEITGGLPAVPAEAQQPVVPAVYSTVQPVMTKHHSHKPRKAHHAKAPVLQAVVQPVVQPVVQLAVVAPGPDLVAQDVGYDQGGYQADQQLYDHYTVREGDTLTHIAAQYGVSWESLFSINSDTIGDQPDAIYVGQILRLPA